jgi:type II secretory pathway pseudopilin PulG
MKRRLQIESRPRQRGVALIVALVVLVIIGFTSAAVMRGALNSDLVANNTRVQTLATQAAQVALAYCESQYGVPGSPLNILPAQTPMAWETYGNWSDNSKRTIVPIGYMQSNLSSFVPSTLPQCMVENSTTGPGGAPTVVITARGFSPDYHADEKTGKSDRGSVVWLQYILAL